MKTLLILIIAISAAICHAQASIGYVYEPRSKAAYEVVTHPVGSVVRPLGLKLNLTASAFAGLGDKNRPMGGFALSYRAKLAENVSLDLGPAVFVSDRKPSGIAVYAGLSWKF